MGDTIAIFMGRKKSHFGVKTLTWILDHPLRLSFLSGEKLLSFSFFGLFPSQFSVCDMSRVFPAKVCKGLAQCHPMCSL